MVLRRVGELVGGHHHLVEGLRHLQAVVLEHLLVVVDQPEVGLHRQAVHAPVGLGDRGHRAGAEIGIVESRRRQLRIGEEGAQIHQPLAGPDDALGHMQREMRHVEAGRAGGQLHHHLRPLLLLGKLLGQHLDAGERLELLLVGLQVIGARALGEADDDLLSFALLPVEGGLRTRPGDQCRRGQGGGRGSQECSASDHGIRLLPFLAAGIPLRNAGALVCWLASQRSERRRKAESHRCQASHPATSPAARTVMFWVSACATKARVTSFNCAAST